MLAPDPPLVIGQRKQLLVDDYVLASTSRLDRQLGEVVKHPHPVLLPDRRWDDPSAFGGYLTVLRDQSAGKFQLWYMRPGRRRGSAMQSPRTASIGPGLPSLRTASRTLSSTPGGT